jgi:hypothetical protein
MAMMAITTRSSMSVKNPQLRRRFLIPDAVSAKNTSLCLTIQSPEMFLYLKTFSLILRHVLPDP